MTQCRAKKPMLSGDYSGHERSLVCLAIKYLIKYVYDDQRKLIESEIPGFIWPDLLNHVDSCHNI